ncbi:MAG TPA: alpha/beta fold hydrolase, partial [Roseiflexaceae bacterium]|nr:alpha/beta fold hydrolase [Roseiflexaceae bacterium]
MPLILLHGGIAASEVFGAHLTELALARQVIAVHLQGHGHTLDIERPLRYEAMADDVAALLAHLGLEQADLLGYSMGGGVALQTAFRHPQLVRRLVVVSEPMQRDGWYPEVISGLERCPRPPRSSAKASGSRRWPRSIRMWTGRRCSPRWARWKGRTTTGPTPSPRSPPRPCSSLPMRTAYGWSTWSRSTSCSAAGSATRASTALPGRHRASRSCPERPITISCRQQQSRAWLRPSSTRRNKHKTAEQSACSAAPWLM